MSDVEKACVDTKEEGCCQGADKTPEHTKEEDCCTPPAQADSAGDSAPSEVAAPQEAS